MVRRNSTELRTSNGWHGGYVEWEEKGTTYISVVFSWLLDRAVERKVELMSQGRSVLIGGSAAEYSGVSDGCRSHAYLMHNRRAVFTTTGCVFSCPFCIVPVTEGELVELPDSDWVPVDDAIVCDNNFTACSGRHFDNVIDRLKSVKRIDIQGVSVLCLESYHAQRLRELSLKVVHIAWDDICLESQFRLGVALLLAAGIPKSKITAYVLIGFNDTPDDALYRLESVRAMGIKPFPMRYQSLDANKRNSYVGSSWTHKELVRFCRYWANLRITSRIPFTEFVY